MCNPIVWVLSCGEREVLLEIILRAECNMAEQLRSLNLAIICGQGYMPPTSNSSRVAILGVPVFILCALHINYGVHRGCANKHIVAIMWPS